MCLRERNALRLSVGARLLSASCASPGERHRDVGEDRRCARGEADRSAAGGAKGSRGQGAQKLRCRPSRRLSRSHWCRRWRRWRRSLRLVRRPREPPGRWTSLWRPDERTRFSWFYHVLLCFTYVLLCFSLQTPQKRVLERSTRPKWFSRSWPQGFRGNLELAFDTSRVF